MSKDFQKWFEWWKKSRPDYPLTEEEAERLYHTFYTCRCESCKRRIEIGLIPIRQSKGCTTPLEPLGQDMGWIYAHLN